MQTNCPHARVQYLISVKTGYPYFKKFPCNKPYQCHECAVSIGKLYEQWILNAISDGIAVYCEGMLADTFKSFSRKYNKSHYRAFPVGADRFIVFHNIPQRAGATSAMMVHDCSQFDWTGLAFEKSAHAQTMPNGRANVSGKLGYKAPEPDGKEAFQDVAVHVEDSIKSEAMPIIRQASAKAFAEKGRAQSVREAEALAQRYGDLVDELMQKAGLAEYTISRVWSRDVFPVSSKAAKDNAENDSENNPLDDDTLEIIERLRQKQAVAD